MGRARPIWGSKRRCAVLLEIATVGMLDPRDQDTARRSVLGNLSWVCEERK
jgi:hypothetical protein